LHHLTHIKTPFNGQLREKERGFVAGIVAQSEEYEN